MNHHGAPLNKLIAVAIDKDRGSQIALKWAVDNLLAMGDTVILIHVKVTASASNDGSGMTELDLQLKELFLPYRIFCTRKGIQCHVVVLEDADVAKAISRYISRTSIEVLILGAAAKVGLLRSIFKIKDDIPGNVVKRVPNFCTVYSISKSGKVSFAQSAVSVAPDIHPLRHQFMPANNVKSNSVTSSLIDPQEKKTIEELNYMSVLLAQRESEIAVLQAQLQQASQGTSTGPGAIEDLQAENAQLKTEIAVLQAQSQQASQGTSTEPGAMEELQAENAQLKAEIALLEAQSQQASQGTSTGPGAMEDLQAENAQLKTEIAVSHAQLQLASQGTSTGPGAMEDLQAENAQLKSEMADFKKH
ncbi:hypothetical protein FXO38_01898 [Capsicum annuum]|uniref:RING-type E3 ubiquitin transferase n=2 Tax=Capsicum annuum TaxID=4072 RepID=A0A2G2YW74_CAPAN|nr:hypothetical protein FXO38_01898 [Capsicum annuum]KAF3683199.1 hypothetical protein FXO37_01984 [Capsicum annuum]PHT74017.1 hypothetical protein T459_21294 [Capsicum annuum]